MDMLTKAMAAFLAWAVRALPEPRNAWSEAILAEAGDAPTGSARLSWLAGGVWTMAKEAGMVRRIGHTLAALAAGGALLWLDWHPGSANPAMPANRITLGITVLVLAFLPWLARRVLGPVAESRIARGVRVAGYLSVFALLTVLVGLSRFAGSRFDHFRAFDQANWEADMRSGAVFSAVLIVAMFGTYAFAILAVTSRRTSISPTVLATGAGTGAAVALFVYALMPFGHPFHIGNGLLSAVYGLTVTIAPLAALVWAGSVASRRATPTGNVADDDARRMRLGALGGLFAGGTAALLLAVLTIATMVLLPEHVALVWANPDPNVPHGTLYEVQMSVGDGAIKYQAALIFGPIVGLVLGALGSGVRPLVGEHGRGREGRQGPTGAAGATGIDHIGRTKGLV